MIKFLLAGCAFLLIQAVNLQAQEGDTGIPDSAYVVDPHHELRDCSTVTEIVPIYLFADDWYYWIQFDFSWQGSAKFDTVIIKGQWAHPSAGTWLDIDTLNKSGQIVIADPWWFFGPGYGICAEMRFDVEVRDTLTLFFPYDGFGLLSENLNAWYPTYQDLNRVLPMSDTLPMSPPGDADCSGFVDISDPVYLIAYIFSNGAAPYDLNAADANADCTVDISDPVYLINYIFANGGIPQPGCVYLFESN